MARNVPVSVAAKVYGKGPQWVRLGLVAGYLPIGFATREGKVLHSVEEMKAGKGRINYYISPQKLFEQTGFTYTKEEK